MAAGTATSRLAHLARQAGCDREPFYVRQPISPALRKTYPAPGWYWVPRGHNFAVYLADSEITSAVELTRLIEEQSNAA